MAQYIKEANGKREAELFLNGAITSGVDMRKMGDFYIHGLTLIFTGASIATVTFNAGAGATTQTPMKLKAVLDQIVSQTSSDIATEMGQDGHLSLVDAGNPSVAVGLASGSTALAKLGFAKETAVAGKFYNAENGATPRLISLLTSPINSTHYIMLVEE